jgi:hypothetical protein
MTLTERFKPIVTKTHEAIFVANDHPFDVTKFNLFNDLVKAFALVIECGANIFYSLINFDLILHTRRPKSVFLHEEVFFL